MIPQKGDTIRVSKGARSVLMIVDKVTVKENGYVKVSGDRLNQKYQRTFSFGYWTEYVHHSDIRDARP